MTIYTLTIGLAATAIVISFGIGIYKKRDFTYYRKIIEMVSTFVAIIAAISYFGGIAFIQNTTYTTSGKEIVELDTVGSTMYDGEEDKTDQYVRLSEADSDESNSYLFNTEDYGRIVTPVRDTSIHYSEDNAMIAARYTRVTANPWTEFFAIANRPVAVKYTVFLPKDSVDLDSKPEAKAYPDFLELIGRRAPAEMAGEIVEEPIEESG